MSQVQMRFHHLGFGLMPRIQAQWIKELPLVQLDPLLPETLLNIGRIRVEMESCSPPMGLRNLKDLH